MIYKLNFTLSEKDRLQILNFALSEYKNRNGIFVGHTESPERNFCKINGTLVPSEIKTLIGGLREKYFQNFGISSWTETAKVVPFIGNFIEVQTEGGFVNSHKDGADPEYHHFRINFLIQKPISGGMPILDNTKVDLQEGQSWINIANLWNHHSEPVKGEKNRIVLSLGGMVPFSDVSVKQFLMNMSYK